MPIQAATVDELQRQPMPPRQVYAVTETVAGFHGARMVTALSDSTIVHVVVPIGWTPNNATVGVSVGYTYLADNSEYHPDFVARILDAAAQPPEAKFNNVVDMLDWLNRD